MDLRAKNKFGKTAINQYCPPLSFELSGRKFELVMDDGHDLFLHFKNEHRLEWQEDESVPQGAAYSCLKADDTTYLVNYELEGISPRVSHTFVLDIENALVTRIIARIGRNPRYPYLIYTDFEFGAIRQKGKELTFKRHGYTSDMIGNVVQWTYGSEMATVHIYYCANFYRITFTRDSAAPANAPGKDWAFNDTMNLTPSTDEPAVYIKIKDGLYLFSLIEQNMEKLAGSRGRFRSNTLCFLQNYNRMYQVGRAFGTTTTENGDTDTNVMIGAYGKFVDIDPSFLTDPNPYLT